MIDTPQQAVAEESRTASLRSRRMFCIEHGAGPVAFWLLAFCHCTGHACELMYEERLSDIVFRHILQHLGQSGQHPSVATGPEIFLAVGRLMLGKDVFAVAEIESRFLVEHDAVTVEQILVELVEVFLIARKPVHFRHHRHHHVECVGPPPIVVCP